ncbi:glycoside hydrolase family 108 protein [Escherichia coli]|uniref:glycoside hydrolase family 108 protein n=1 Tax=Enterobacterales TaxID=91347 RepID=UPI00389122B6
MTNFEICMKFTGLAEGGYTKLPGDTGGETNHGISDARDGKLDGRICGVPTGLSGSICVPVKQLTKAQAEAIYRKEYFDPIRGDELHPAVACAVFDFGVNSGVTRAVKALQRACSVAQDGALGPVTVAKANSLNPHPLAQSVCNIRIDFLTNSTAPTIVKYRAALVARARRCADYCQTL